MPLQLTYDTAYETMLAVLERRDRLDAAIAELAAGSPFIPVVRRLGCLRGSPRSLRSGWPGRSGTGSGGRAAGGPGDRPDRQTTVTMLLDGTRKAWIAAQRRQRRTAWAGRVKVLTQHCQRHAERVRDLPQRRQVLHDVDAALDLLHP
jgi:hypothetical protein